MDQSLESIIKSKRQEKRTTNRSRPNTAEKKTFKSSGGGRGTNKVKSGGASAAATAAAAQRKTVVVRRQREPAATSTGQGSIFDRLGTAGSGRVETGGTKVEIRGLTKAVTKADITQLCESIGDVKAVYKKFDTAEVVFDRRSHAMSAIKKFHGLTLDGVPMTVTLAGERGRSNPFDPNDPGGDEGGGRGKSNVREGFFGTRGSSTPQASTIDFGYKKPAKAREQTITVTINNRERNGGGGRGGQRDSRGGRGGGKGGKGGRGAGKRAPRQSSPAKTQADLDREMDEYLSAR